MQKLKKVFTIFTATTTILWSIGVAAFLPNVALAHVTPPTTYIITASAGAGGSISPSGSVSVIKNANQIFTITPSTGYIVNDVLVDGASQGRINSYTFTNITTNHTIAASFDSGWKQPSDFTDNHSVGEPQKAYSSNDNRADFNDHNDRIQYKDFNLSIPSGATINGISVAVEAQKVYNDTRTLNISLSHNGGTNFTAAGNTGNLVYYTDTTKIIGDSTNTWSRTWSASDFSNTNFRVKVSRPSSESGTVNLDQIQVKIYYTEAPTTSDLTVTKTVIGGTKNLSDFPLQLDGMSITSGIATTTSAGAHTISETNNVSYNYVSSFSGSCDTNGRITLTAGVPETCTVTNTFTPICTPGNSESCGIDLPGICSTGSKTCDADGNWGSCIQTIYPTSEVCSDNLDNDCDGVVNNGCPVCGNGNIETGEQCDDANTQNGDGCSSTCQTEQTAPVCGNYTIETGEQCDDGNIQNGDGCSSACQNEQTEPVCGNGIKETGEQCDGTDGVITGYLCNDDCILEQNQTLLCDPNIELIKNGGFENPVVTDTTNWDVFASGTTDLEWFVEWYAGSSDASRPTVANLELERGVNGWQPATGSQYAELDSDWRNSENNFVNGAASVKIYQDLATTPGQKYRLKYSFSPRPGASAAENILEVKWEGGLIDTKTSDGATNSNTAWTNYETDLTSASATSRIEFADLGTPNSIGTFLDEVSLRCIPQTIIDADNDGIADATDNCPYIANPAQEDVDGDRIGNVCDNCANTANADQADSDNDKIGNSCDNCASVANAGQEDDDGDSLGNACDNFNCRITGTEVCNDQIDNDCNGFVDSDDTVCQSTSICGNQITETGEQCDDGNTANGDGCSSTCQNEQTGPVCGNSVKEGDEQCDGADGVGEHQACMEGCVLVNLPYCGDNIRNNEEQCDGEAGVTEGNRCTAQCTLEQIPPPQPPGGGGGGGGGTIIPLAIHTISFNANQTRTIIVTWFTTHAATSRVVYDTVPHSGSSLGAPPNYGYAYSTIEDENKVTFHMVTLTGLLPKTKYYIRPISHGSPEVFGDEVSTETLTEEVAPAVITPPAPTPTPAPATGGTVTEGAVAPAITEGATTPAAEGQVAGEETQQPLPSETTPTNSPVTGSFISVLKNILGAWWFWLIVIILGIWFFLWFRKRNEDDNQK
ncbi:MAG: DUF4215 domain-containing protein [Candidatus Buchananbacteria bacterium]